MYEAEPLGLLGYREWRCEQCGRGHRAYTIDHQADSIAGEGRAHLAVTGHPVRIDMGTTEHLAPLRTSAVAGVLHRAWRHYPVPG